MARTNKDNARRGFTNFTPPSGNLKTTSATGRALVDGAYEGAPIIREERDPKGLDGMAISVVPGEPAFAGVASMPGDPAGNQLGKGRSGIKTHKNEG